MIATDEEVELAKSLLDNEYGPFYKNWLLAKLLARLEQAEARVKELECGHAEATSLNKPLREAKP